MAFFSHLGRKIGDLFPEREFHYRANGEVRYFRLSRSRQIFGVMVAMVIVAWSGYSVLHFALDSGSVSVGSRSVETAALKQSTMRREQDRLVSEVAVLNRKLGEMSGQLLSYRNQLGGLVRTGRVLVQNGGLKDKVSGPLRAALAKHAVERLSGKSLAAAKKAAPRLGRETGKDMVPASASVSESAGILKARKGWLTARVTRLNRNLKRIRRDRGRVLGMLDAKASRSIEELEKVILMTGLKPKHMLARLNSHGRGGRTVAVMAKSNPADAYRDQRTRVERRLREWRQMQKIIRHLPLIAPVDHYRSTSPYGKRRDPLRGGWAVHKGQDFAYHMNAPILATAAGKVTFAGWRGGYGWMIEIDHGFGIRTRYAHLKKILVEKGQKVAFRGKIGLLGSSGRSSGPHVHYEIVINGRPHNPAKFITAGKYVFKG
jgi:murein DD-endopeptidase MepM/ murein hydrolase activator NlpD